LKLPSLSGLASSARADAVNAASTAQARIGFFMVEGSFDVVEAELYRFARKNSLKTHPPSVKKA